MRSFTSGGASPVRALCSVLLRSVLPAAALLPPLPTPGASQADGDPITMGTYRILPSRIMDEDRILQVHLPEGYETADIAYPVVYLLYSDRIEEYFAQLVNDLSLLTIDRMPPVILVGVPNTQRYRDLLPWSRPGRPPGEGEGHADRFLRFVREELIPFVDAEYRTEPYRILVGPQTASVFGVYTLLEAPGTFQAFILNDPCQLDGPERSLCRELTAFATSPQARETFLAVSDDGDSQRLRELREGLSAAAPGFRWRIGVDPAWPFFLAPVQAREGLLDLFADYTFPAPDGARSLAEIRAHYDALSARLGFTVEAPDLILSRAADGMVERQEYPAALEVLKHLVEIHPSSLNGPWRLANLHRLTGDTATAIRYYEECLRRDPNMTPAREWLRRLKGGGGGPLP